MPFHQLHPFHPSFWFRLAQGPDLERQKDPAAQQQFFFLVMAQRQPNARNNYHLGMSPIQSIDMVMTFMAVGLPLEWIFHDILQTLGVFHGYFSWGFHWKIKGISNLMQLGDINHINQHGSHPFGIGFVIKPWLLIIQCGSRKKLMRRNMG